MRLTKDRKGNERREGDGKEMARGEAGLAVLLAAALLARLRVPQKKKNCQRLLFSCSSVGFRLTHGLPAGRRRREIFPPYEPHTTSSQGDFPTA
jgi:hypothetical protein